MMGFVHHLTHRHDVAVREGVGRINFCCWRLSRFVSRAYFQPDFDGASWHLITEEMFTQLLACRTPHQAMAIVRETS